MTDVTAPAVKRIVAEAEQVAQRIRQRQKPQMKLPIRALANVRYHPRSGYFRLNGRKKVRTLTVATVRTFAQTLKMLSMSLELIRTGRHSTKREAYYQAYNWQQAAFAAQEESDTVMDDVEAMLGVNREQLHFRADEHGGEVAGELIVIDRDRRSGKRLEIDCTRFGSGAYSVPTVVEDLELPHEGQVHPGRRDQGHVRAAGGGGLPQGPPLHPGVDGRRAQPGVPAVHPPPGRRATACPCTSSPTATRTATSTSTAR